MMTVGEHDNLWKNAFKCIPEIEDSLRRNNILIILKELHNLGISTDEEYARDLGKLSRMEGFVINYHEKVEE